MEPLKYTFPGCDLPVGAEAGLTVGARITTKVGPTWDLNIQKDVRVLVGPA